MNYIFDLIRVNCFPIDQIGKQFIWMTSKTGKGQSPRSITDTNHNHYNGCFHVWQTKIFWGYWTSPLLCHFNQTFPSPLFFHLCFKCFHPTMIKQRKKVSNTGHWNLDNRTTTEKKSDQKKTRKDNKKVSGHNCPVSNKPEKDKCLNRTEKKIEKQLKKKTNVKTKAK